MDENSKNFNKEKEGIKKYQIKLSEMKGTIDELKNILEGFSSKLDVTREWHNILKCWGGKVPTKNMWQSCYSELKER